MSDGTDWCRHYQGVGKVCDAGVDPTSVRLRVADGNTPDRYPCFETDGVADRCPSCSYYTPEERAAIKQEAGAAATKYLNDLAAGVCPFCGVKIERERQVGRCVYAEPCNHRLYQGKAKAFSQMPTTQQPQTAAPTAPAPKSSAPSTDMYGVRCGTCKPCQHANVRPSPFDARFAECPDCGWKGRAE